MSEPVPTLDLTGKTIAVPETRELAVLARLFEKRGATVIRCPLVAIHDVADQTPIVAWLHRFIAGDCDDLVLLTGEGLRRLVAAAERVGLKDAFVAALAKVRRTARGPKPVRALRDVGLDADIQAKQPTTNGVIAALAEFDMAGRTVGVQLYGDEPNRPLMDFLVGAGASVDAVAPYRYASKVDDERVADLIDRLAAHSVDAVAFTSASQVRRLWAVARQRACEATLRDALDKTLVAAVGPVVADALRSYGILPDVMPPRVFAMKPFVMEIGAALQAQVAP